MKGKQSVLGADKSGPAEFGDAFKTSVPSGLMTKFPKIFLKILALHFYKNIFIFYFLKFLALNFENFSIIFEIFSIKIFENFSIIFENVSIKF